MYKLLIVDDELLVLEGLKKLVDWKKYNMHIIGEASSGQEGIVLAREMNPDIVITDIRMPDLSGLDMMKRISDINPRTKFLVLSGYDDFNWAKKAFNYGAVDYLLKPVDLEQLNAVLQKIVDKISEADLSDKQSKEIGKTLSRSHALLKKDVLNELLNGQYFSEEMIREKLEFLQLRLGEGPCVVMVFKDKDSLESPVDNIYPKKDVLNNVLQFLEEKNWGYGFKSEEGKIIFIVTVPGANPKWSHVLAEYVYQRFGMEESGIVIGIGGEYDRLGRIKISFIEAERAIEYQYLSDSPVVCYNDIQKLFLGLEKIDYPLQFAEIVMEGLKTANGAMLKQTLESYYARIQQKKAEINHFKSVMTELLFVISKELKSINIDLSKVFIDEFEDIYSIRKKHTLDDIWEVVEQFIFRVLNYIETTVNKSNKQIITEVLRIIDENFTSSDLSLNDVAGKIYLTPNYVSMLIKKEIGQNFSDIILKKRIEKAKELLFEETLKTYEIAGKVGYVDQNYFFKAFRKVVGMTPGEFRNKFCG